MAAVSVILPTYNRAAVLERAIRSVLAQTFSDLELVVVDDGSEDGSEQVIGSFDDPRLVYIRNEHTGSPAVARNVGIRATTAPLIAFQDSDDEWLIGKLARQVQAMHEAGPEVGLVCGGYILHSARGSVSYWGADSRMRKGDWGADNIYDFGFIAPTWLIRRTAIETVGLFDEDMANLEDWELAFRLFRHAGIVALDEPLVLKHGTGDGVNDKPGTRIASLARIIQRHGDIWREHPRVLARLYEELGRWRSLQGNMRAGRADFARSLHLHPGSLKRWGHWGASWLGAAAYRRLWSLWSQWRQVR